MESVIIEVKGNCGSERATIKVFSHETLTEAQQEELSTLSRDEAMKYASLRGWKAIDISEWT